jgi:hypothetical protein
VQFDAAEYIFVGEVTGVVGPSHSELVAGEVWGLRIKIKEVVSLPDGPAKYVELYTYTTGAACEAQGVTDPKRYRQLPKGLLVRVIAKRSNGGDNRLPGGGLRVDDRGYHRGPILSGIAEDQPFSSRVSSINDFRMPFDFDAYTKKSKRTESYRENSPEWYREMAQFELRKELLRLKNAKSQKENGVILERVAFYPRFLDDEVDYSAIVEANISDIKRREVLIDAWRRWAFPPPSMIACNKGVYARDRRDCSYWKSYTKTPQR